MNNTVKKAKVLCIARFSTLARNWIVVDETHPYLRLFRARNLDISVLAETIPESRWSLVVCSRDWAQALVVPHPSLTRINHRMATPRHHA